MTLRTLPPADVAAIAADAGLRTIEWGGDIHVPPGDLAKAEQARELTARHGLTVASYGSYFRAGTSDPAEIEPVVATAEELGAARIRIWAGRCGSAEATPAQRSAVVASARCFADRAARAGITVGFEFHGGTLTDDHHSATALLAEINRADVVSYWQPPNSVSDAEALAGLDELMPAVAAVHAFSWWPGTVRHRLVARAGLWQAVLRRLRERGHDLEVLLEFVPDDDPALVAGEAAMLRSWIDQASPAS